MINYKVLKAFLKSGTIIYYLCTNDYKHKYSINSYYRYGDNDIYVYKDVYSSYRSQIRGLNAYSFIELKYIEVQELCIFIQNNNKNKSSNILLEDLQRILLYWDDYN